MLTAQPAWFATRRRSRAVRAALPCPRAHRARRVWLPLRRSTNGLRDEGSLRVRAALCAAVRTGCRLRSWLHLSGSAGVQLQRQQRRWNAERQRRQQRSCSDDAGQATMPAPQQDLLPPSDAGAADAGAAKRAPTPAGWRCRCGRRRAAHDAHLRVPPEWHQAVRVERDPGARKRWTAQPCSRARPFLPTAVSVGCAAPEGADAAVCDVATPPAPKPEVKRCIPPYTNSPAVSGTCSSSDGTTTSENGSSEAVDAGVGAPPTAAPSVSAPTPAQDVPAPQHVKACSVSQVGDPRRGSRACLGWAWLR